MEHAAASNSGFAAMKDYIASSLPAIAEDLPTCLLGQAEELPHMEEEALSSLNWISVGYPNIGV